MTQYDQAQDIKKQGEGPATAERPADVVVAERIQERPGVTQAISEVPVEQLTRMAQDQATPTLDVMPKIDGLTSTDGQPVQIVDRTPEQPAQPAPSPEARPGYVEFQGAKLLTTTLVSLRRNELERAGAQG